LMANFLISSCFFSAVIDIGSLSVKSPKDECF
jgi:hypothetical protein